MINRKALLLLIAVLAIPAGIQLFYIFRFGVNIVFCDQWNFVPVLEKWYSGSLSFSDLISQDGEHRIFLPRIAMLVIAILTHYNTVAEMVASWSILVLTALAILIMYIRSNRITIFSAVGFLPVTLLLFNYRQNENILWGWQIAYYLAIFFFILSIFLLERTDGFSLSFYAALVSAILSSFSNFYGLFTWITCFIFLLILQKKRELLIVWGITGFLTILAYFWQWQKPLGNPQFFLEFTNSFYGITFFLTNIGSPLLARREAYLFGLLILCLCAVVFWIAWKKKMMQENSKWIAIIVFSLLSSVAILIGRGEMGLATSLWSRYTQVTVLAVVGLYLISLDIFRSQGKKSLFYTVIFILVTLIVINSAAYGYAGFLKSGEKSRMQRLNAADSILNYKNEVLVLDELNLFDSSDYVLKQIQTLDYYNLNVFYNCDRLPSR